MWLAAAGEKQWVVLTKDVRIRHNPLLLNALCQASVAAFVLGRADLTGPTMAAAFIAALPRMRKALRRFETPFIATVTKEGLVSVVHDCDGPARPAKRIK